jgi:hypothetical protein
MQWIIKNLWVCLIIQQTVLLNSSSAWFFFKLMNVSGAEAVVAAASPWIGQGCPN